MKCDEFDARIHQLLDERTPLQTDRRLLQHVEDCGRCRNELDGYEDLFNGLDFFEPPKLPEDFAARIVEQVQPVRPSTKVARPWLALAALAIAATLLFVLLPALTGRPARTKSEPARLAREDTPSELPGESSHANSPGGQICQLSQGSADIPEGIDPEQIRLMWNQLAPELPYEQIVPVDQIKGGLRPITNSLAAAIDVLRSTIPLGRESESTESNGSTSLPQMASGSISA